MLRIHLLGRLALLQDERPFRFPAGSRTTPLLAWLLIHGRHPVQRSSLAFRLWPDMGESDARGVLRRHLHELRSLLPPEEDAPWILADAATVQWNPAADTWVDVEAFEHLCAEGDRLADAVALYSGDLLPDLYDDWLIADRERLRTRFLDALHTLVQRHRRQGDDAAAIAFAQQLLQHDALREDVVRELMLARSSAGDRVGAMQEYQRFEQRIRDELGVPPMLETSALYDAIARQRPAPGSPPAASRPATAPPAALGATTAGAPALWATAPDEEPLPPTNLPAPLTAFVGRDTELATLQTLLGDARSPLRLLTLTGPGGSGKSRLAIEFAARLRSRAPAHVADGLMQVLLAGVRSHDAVLPAIAEALHVREAPGQPLIESLRAFLRPRRLLLILDNFEHLIEVAPLVGALLAAAPGLRVLVTSRTALRIYGEHEFPVTPLPLPPLSGLSAPGDLARFASVALFVARSRAVNPTFSLNRDNATDIARICQQLDGLPLALELAAARSKLLTPAAILARLEHRLSFLVARDRHAHDRHQTMRTALEWSYNLLSAEERALFRRVAVFAGSFALEAAEALCESTGALARVESLLDNSLLQSLASEADEPLPEGSGVRLRLLATVRDYALERLLEAGEEPSAQRRLAAMLIALLARSQNNLRGGDQAGWLRLLELEHDNLRASLRWTLGPSGDGALALDLAAAAGLFWLLAGHWREGVHWLQAALEADRDALPARRGPAHLALGFLIMAHGDLTPALPHFEEGLRLCTAAGDPRGIADALFGLARIAIRRRRYADADTLLQQTLDLAQAEGYAWRTGYAYNLLAMRAAEVDELAHASELLDASLAAMARIENRIGMAQIYTAMGEIDRMRDDYARAAGNYAQALALAEALGQKARLMMVKHNLGHIALHERQPRRAVTFFQEALQLGKELPDQENFAMCLLGLAAAAAQQGDLETAARLFGAGEAALQAIGADLAPADQREYVRNLAAARAACGDDAAFEAQRRAGRALSPAEAEALAAAL